MNESSSSILKSGTLAKNAFIVVSALVGTLLCCPAVAGANWTLTSFVDEMTSKTGQRVETISTNAVTFRFPYGGPQHGILTLRRHPRFGNNVFLSIPKGQFICGVTDCDVLVRFDDGKPIEYRASAPADHSSNVLFLEDHDTFFSNLLKANVVRIEAEFYQDGRNIFTFGVANLPASFLEESRKEQRAAEKARLDAENRVKQEQLDAIAHARALADAERRRLGMTESKVGAEPVRDAQQNVRDDWIDRISSKIEGRVVVPPNIEGNPLVRFEVVLLPGGRSAKCHAQKIQRQPGLRRRRRAGHFSGPAASTHRHRPFSGELPRIVPSLRSKRPHTEANHDKLDRRLQRIIYERSSS